MKSKLYCEDNGRNTAVLTSSYESHYQTYSLSPGHTVYICKSTCPLSLIQTSSEGRHSVRISGLSNIDFRSGFSRKPTLDFKQTSSRPVQGLWGQPRTPQLLFAFSHLLCSLTSFSFGTLKYMFYHLPRYSHSHPSEHHWAFTSCSGWQTRAPVNQGRCD